MLPIRSTIDDYIIDAIKRSVAANGHYYSFGNEETIRKVKTIVKDHFPDLRVHEVSEPLHGVVVAHPNARLPAHRT